MKSLYDNHVLGDIPFIVIISMRFELIVLYVKWLNGRCQDHTYLVGLAFYRSAKFPQFIEIISPD